MDTSWLSTTSSGVFNYVYKHITGDEDESPGPSSSLEVLSKANVWITDLPTNNYEPLEVSHGKRRAAKKVGVVLLFVFVCFIECSINAFFSFSESFDVDRRKF